MLEGSVSGKQNPQNINDEEDEYAGLRVKDSAKESKAYLPEFVLKFPRGGLGFKVEKIKDDLINSGFKLLANSLKATDKKLALFGSSKGREIINIRLDVVRDLKTKGRDGITLRNILEDLQEIHNVYFQYNAE
jgi:hypothetical protein